MRASHCPLARHVVAQKVFADSPLGLVDVGCSGGLDPRWDLFGDQRRAWGFDPLEGEIARLRALGRPDTTYHAAWVGYKDYDTLIASGHARPDHPEISNDPGPRLSCWTITDATEISRRYDSSGGQITYTTERLDLDDFFAAPTRAAVDFLKVDTDGHDHAALLGARELLRSAPVLGVQVESNFHGQLHPEVRVFANTDRLLREAGFSLFDIESHRYSRSALPAPFVSGIPGDTTKGQLWWGDFLYFRDAAAPDYERYWGELPPPKLLKLTCLFESYDLADCAAEVLVRFKERLSPLVDVDRCLDLLASSMSPGISYAEYLRRAATDRTFLFGAPPRPSPAPTPPSSAGERPSAPAIPRRGSLDKRTRGLAHRARVLLSRL